MREQAGRYDRANAMYLTHPRSHGVRLGVDIKNALDLALDRLCLIRKPADDCRRLGGIGHRAFLVVRALPIILAQIVVVHEVAREIVRDLGGGFLYVLARQARHGLHFNDGVQWVLRLVVRSNLLVLSR